MRTDKGIERHGNGWRAFVRVAGDLKRQWFPLDTPRHEMRAWREQQKAAAPATAREVATGQTTFSQDIALYLQRVQAMPTYSERAVHLNLWADALGGDRPRHLITAHDIERVLQAWQTEPRAADDARPLGPATVKKRRVALLAFYTKLNGKGGLNPVKGTATPREPKAGLHAIDYGRIEQAIALMPAWRDRKPRVPSLAGLRVRVIAYTGFPPGILQKVTPHDLTFQASPTEPFGSVRIAPRLKGEGVEGRTVPLTPDGLAAFQAFHEANAYGPFSTTALNVSFKAAARRIGLTKVRLYDLRHSFLTELYRTVRDLATVARMALHAEGSPATARYAKAAMEHVDAAAVQAFGQRQIERRRQALKVAPGRRRTSA